MKKITEQDQPKFPCWLFDAITGLWSHWGQYTYRVPQYLPPLCPHKMTHWHPDQPTAPTARPGAEGETMHIIVSAEDSAAHEKFFSAQMDRPASAAAPDDPAENAVKKFGGYNGFERAAFLNGFRLAYADLEAELRTLRTDNQSLRAAQKACEDCMSPTQAEKDAELARLSGLHHFWTEKLSELAPEKLVSECIMRAVCRDADLVKLDRLTSELAATKAELEIRTRQRDYWMDDRTKHKARAEAAEKEVAGLREWERAAREALGQLQGNQNGCPLPTWKPQWDEAMRLTAEVLAARTPPAATQAGE